MPDTFREVVNDRTMTGAATSNPPWRAATELVEDGDFRGFLVFREVIPQPAPPAPDTPATKGADDAATG